MKVISVIIFVAVFIFLLTYLGNCLFILVKSVIEKDFASQKAEEKPKDNPLKGGRVIGVLERILITLGIVLHNWEIIVGVVTFKSVARFQELNSEEKAEYFLIGSFFSLLWAIFMTLLFMWLEDVLYRMGILDVRPFQELYRIYK